MGVGGVQVGVASFSYGCAFENYAGMYVRLCTYMPWMKTIVHSLPVVPPCVYKTGTDLPSLIPGEYSIVLLGGRHGTSL